MPPRSARAVFRIEDPIAQRSAPEDHTGLLETFDASPALRLRQADALADLRGHWVLLWWFPKAATPG